MTGVRARGEQVRQFILDRVEQSPNGVAQAVGEKFGISRQAANIHLRQLCDEGILERSGRTRATRYRLAVLFKWERPYEISSKPPEDVVWTRDVRGVLGELPENAMDIWHYGFTEMFNNAIDHSEGNTVVVGVVRTAVNTEVMIGDDGYGIFRKIRHALELLDERHAVLELSKGKLTTDPQNHTGEGIFFASRMFDHFEILSGEVYFAHEFGQVEDWILERNKESRGTHVFMRLSNRTTRTSREVFDEYASGDDFGFTKTVVPVRMARYGEDQLISRSQAKRLLARVDLFETVLFDFREVDTVGPAFIDEMFRVFAMRHPEIELEAINSNPEIDRTIERARANLKVLQTRLREEAS